MLLLGLLQIWSTATNFHNGYTTGHLVYLRTKEMFTFSLHAS